METITLFAHYALSFIVILSVIVFVHEFGHYFVARMCGVKIDVFSIGFGREIWGYTAKSGTRWKLSALPLGGYVKMFGDSSEASTPSESLDRLSDEHKKLTFHFKPLYQKALIVAAGPIANFILTITIFTYFLMVNGMPSSQPIIGEIIKDTPAQEAGLMPDDRVLTVNGQKMEMFNDIPQAIITNLGAPVQLEIDRGGKIIALTIVPKMVEEKDSLGNNYKRPLIGFKSKEIRYEDVGFFRAIGEAARSTYNICRMTLKVIGQIIVGERDTSDIKGPLGIAKLSGQATEQGPNTILWFIALISANLGFANLLPIPLLDGGHLLYYLAEAIRGKPLAKRVQEVGYALGMVFIVGLMLLALLNDVRSFFI